MRQPFAISYAKLERSRKFIGELETLLENYLKNDPVVFKGEPVHHPDGGLSAPYEWKGMGHASTVVIGDALHNARAALDLMATELVVLNGDNPTGVHFPFAKSEAELEEQIKQKKFHRAGADAIALLKRFAPYKGGNRDLRALHDLDLIDKHGGKNSHVRTPTTADLVFHFRHNGTCFEPMPPQISNVKYFFAEDSDLAGMELVPTLKDLVQVVESILEAFTALVASRT